MDMCIIEVELPRNGSIFRKLGQEGFFWNDSVNPTMEYGPFPTIYDATNHYKIALIERKSKRKKNVLEFIKPVNNVIQVDFKNKKRVS